MPPMVLVAVVALAVPGRSLSPGPPPTGDPLASPVAAAVARAAAPSGVRATPSPRSDWPAAIDGRDRGAASSAAPDPIDWASLYDERATWAADKAESRRSHRLGAFANYRTDPYER